jgi:Zn/Cd-binding protein ZinT
LLLDRGTMEKEKKNSDDAIASKKIAEWVKKTLLTSVGAMFLTEESIRNALMDLKIPKAVITMALSQAEKTKQDISAILAKEIRLFLEKIKIDDLIEKALRNQTIEIKASIKFKGKKTLKKTSEESTP